MIKMALTNRFYDYAVFISILKRLFDITVVLTPLKLFHE